MNIGKFAREVDPSAGLAICMAIGMAIALALDISLIIVLGFTESMDALVMALTVPLFIDTVFRESFRSILVPHFAEKSREQGKESTKAYALRLMFTAALFGALLALFLFGISALALSEVIGLTAGPRLNEAIHLLWILLPIVVFAFPATIASIHANYEKKFRLFGSRQIVVFGIPLLVLLLSAPFDNRVTLVAIGYLAGQALYLLFAFRAIEAQGIKLQKTFLSEHEIKEISVLGRLMVLGFGIRQIARFAERGISFALGEGVLSAYYLAFRVYSALQSIAGIAVSTSALSDLAEAWFSRSRQTFASILKVKLLQAFVAAVCFGIVAALAFWLTAWINNSLGFLDSDRLYLSRELFWILVIGLPPAAVVAVMVASLHASNNPVLVFWNMAGIGLLQLVLVLALGLWLGIFGVALGVLLSVVCSLISLAIATARIWQAYCRTQGA